MLKVRSRDLKVGGAVVDDSENMIVTQNEISALKKLIMYVKFSCDDE